MLLPFYVKCEYDFKNMGIIEKNYILNDILLLVIKKIYYNM